MPDAEMINLDTSNDDVEMSPDEPVTRESSSEETLDNNQSQSKLTPITTCNYGARLAFAIFKAPPPAAETLNKQSDTCLFFTVDTALVYLSFFQDWGPLNVAMFYRFSLHLHGLLEDKVHGQKKVVLFASEEHDKKANAALLMALYAMVVLRWTPAEALHPVAHLELRPFRDAGYARADFHLSLQDVVFGIRKAIDNRLLKLDEFDVREYETFEKVENGDWNFITPHFLAFASPVEPGYTPMPSASTDKTATNSKLPKAFRNVLDQFEKKNVKMVIRLNKKLYDAKHFTSRDMQHLEMFYEDGTNPTMDQCRQFIDVSEHIIRNDGVVAVHCKAGLGRTGTLIGAFMIYRWGFTASEAIAFQRFMRPGCVVGPQQHFLYTHQQLWVKWAAQDAVSGATRSLPSILSSSPVSRPDTPPSETEIARQIEEANLRSPSTNGPVPGQPRKTPGAKSRHAVALPETNEESENPSDELMLVKTTAADDEESNEAQDIEAMLDFQSKGPSQAEMEVDLAATREAQCAQREADADMVSVRPSQSSSRSKSAVRGSKQPSRPTSRSSSRARSQTDIADPATSCPTAPTLPHTRSDSSLTRAQPASPSSVTRSKASKNLGNLLVDDKGKATSALSSSPSSGGSELRYNLRGTPRSNSDNRIATISSSQDLAVDPLGGESIEAASRLPRVKRRNTSKTQPLQQTDVFAPPAATKATRSSVRRKRTNE